MEGNMEMISFFVVVVVDDDNNVYLWEKRDCHTLQEWPSIEVGMAQADKTNN